MLLLLFFSHLADGHFDLLMKFQGASSAASRFERNFEKSCSLEDEDGASTE
jgi:hypothetical protein